MKLQTGFLLLCFVVYSSAGNGLAQKEEFKCESVLSNMTCTTLRFACKILKLDFGIIEKGVQSAINSGQTLAPDIYRTVVDFLKNHVIKRKCEYLISAQLCTKIKNALSPFNLAKLAGKIVLETILSGPPSKYELLRRLMVAVRKEVEGKECEEVLAEKMCTKLKDMGLFFGIKAAKVSYYVIEAAIAGYADRYKIYAAVLNSLRSDTKSLTCNDILKEKVCASLFKAAAVFGLQPDEIGSAVKDAILNGNLILKDIISFVKRHISKLALGKTCEDLLPQKICAELRETARKWKLNLKVVDEAVREVLKKGDFDINTLKKVCFEFFKRRLSCESWLGDKTCSYIRSFARMLGVQLKDVEAKFQQLIIENHTATSKIFKLMINFIKGQIFG